MNYSWRSRADILRHAKETPAHYSMTLAEILKQSSKEDPVERATIGRCLGAATYYEALIAEPFFPPLPNVVPGGISC